MGIFGFGKNKRTGKNNSLEYNNEQDKDSKKPDIVFSNDKVKTSISFGELENVSLDNGMQRLLQRVNILYDLSDGSFNGRNCYVELNENGTSPKELFCQMSNADDNFVKGFFDMERITSKPTDYIGGFRIDSKTGRPKKVKHEGFEKAYKDHLTRARIREEKQRESNFSRELHSQVENIKTSHAEYLGDEKWIDPYRNNNDVPSR